MPIKKTKLVRLLRCSAKSHCYGNRDSIEQYKKMIGKVLEVEVETWNGLVHEGCYLYGELYNLHDSTTSSSVYVRDCEDHTPPPRLKVRTIRCL